MKLRLLLPKKRWKRVALYGACASLALLAIDLAWVRFWRRISISPQTTGISQPLNAAGTPDYVTALNQRFGEGVTAENNAFPPLLKIISAQRYTPAQRQSLLTDFGIAESQLTTPQVIDFMNWAQQLPAGRRLDSTEADKQDTDMSQKPWRRTDKPLAWEWLNQQQQGLTDAREAALKPRLFIPWGPRQEQVRGMSGSIASKDSPLSCTMPILSGSRMLANMLRADAFRCAGEGNWPRFREDVLTICLLSRLISTGPTLIEVLVAVAIDSIASFTVQKTLSSIPIPADQAETLLAQMARLPPVGSMAVSFDTAERWLSLDDAAFAAQVGFARWHEAHMEERDALTSGFSSSPRPSLPLLSLSWQVASGTVPVNFDHCLREMNKVYDRLTAASRLAAYADRVKEVTQIVHEYSLPDPGASDILSRPTRVLLGDMDSLPRVFVLAQRSQAQRDMTLIALALDIYYIAHKAYPATLADLQKETNLVTFSMDDFTGKPYVYHPTPEGYVLYTPGDENQTEGDRSLERWGVVRVPQK